MAQALASPGLFSDDEAAVSPVLESTAAGFSADVRKDLLSEFSAISPNLEGSQVRLELFCHKQGSVFTHGCCSVYKGDVMQKQQKSSEEAGTKFCIEGSSSWESSGQQVSLGVMLGLGVRPLACWSNPLDKQTNKNAGVAGNA